MTGTKKARAFFCVAAMLVASRLFAVPVGAQPLESGQAIKGSTAAGSSFLDRSTYVDSSAYENRPCDVRTVRIGLRYGEDAASEALFTNVSGAGFSIGSYTEDRAFLSTAQVDAASVTVSCSMEGSVWHILLDGEFDTREKAESFAAAYGGFVDTVDGSYRAFYGSYGSREAAERDRDRYRLPGAAYTESGGRLRVLDSQSGRVLFTAEEQVSALALVPVSEGKGLTQFGADRFYGGFECLVLEPGRMNVINVVELEDYVKGVIPYEMNYSWPYEALRAQAVCARTYVVYNQNEYGEQGFDITGDTYSQVYQGVLEANETTDAAVDSTAGQLIRYKGEICQIYYSAADGGATEDGLVMFDADRPYLTGKEDPFEQAVNFSVKSWTAWRGGEELSYRLQRQDYQIGTVTRLEPEYSDTGNVIAISLYDGAGGSVRLTGRQCYSALGLNSCRYTVEQTGDLFVFYGSGLGHSCGMSQWGAYAMASVYGFDYEDIIRFYYTGAYIA